MTKYLGQELPGGVLDIDIAFADDGTFGGFGGCSDYSGEWSLDGTSLSITGFEQASSGACTQVAEGFELGFFSALSIIDTAELGTDGSLTLASSFAPDQGFVFAPAG
jgi:heat shock protein HslJ